MLLASALEQLEVRAELAVKLLRAVPHHLQTAALGGAVWCERGHHHVATSANRGTHLLHIPLTIGNLGQEVKHSSVVPDVIRGGRQGRVEDIGLQPRHACGVLGEPR